MDQAPIICTVDVVLLCLKNQALHVALLRRQHSPFTGTLALPGGYIHPEEDSDTKDAAIRMLRDKASITSPYLEQLGTFSGNARDPRGWSLSVAYYALVNNDLIDLNARPQLQLTPVDELKSLPFDHRDIIRTAIERVRNKSTYSSLPVFLCGEQFTLPQLQTVYETVLGESINKVSFRRKMDELGILEPVEGAMETGRANRPAQLYRLRKQYLHQLSLTDRGINPD